MVIIISPFSELHLHPFAPNLYFRIFPRGKTVWLPFLGHEGDPCLRSSDCIEGHCCARHFWTKICKPVLHQGEVCTKQRKKGSHGLEIFQRCDCAKGLSCKVWKDATSSSKSRLHVCQKIWMAIEKILLSDSGFMYLMHFSIFWETRTANESRMAKVTVRVGVEVTPNAFCFELVVNTSEAGVLLLCSSSVNNFYSLWAMRVCKQVQWKLTSFTLLCCPVIFQRFSIRATVVF